LSPLMELDLERSWHDVTLFKRPMSLSGDNNEVTVTIMDLPTDVRFWKIIADDIRLAQVFRNLISNALKFTKMGGMYTCEDLLNLYSAIV